MANKVYNINAMRPAILKARENGNRQVISKSMCTELGISETYFEMYLKDVDRLFAAVCAYCRLKNSPKADSAAVDAAYNSIFPIWKEMLSMSEKEKMTRELRVTEHDISNLVSFCQTFVNDSNDTSLGKDETFVALKVWAVQPLKAFQKKVEIDLGIRVAQVEVLSDEQRDFLRAEGKILSRKKKAERRIEEYSVNKEKLVALKAKMKGAEAKEMLDEQIADMDAQIALLTEKITGYDKQYEDLVNPPAPVEEPPAAPQNAAPEKKSRSRKPKAATANDTIVVDKPAA